MQFPRRKRWLPGRSKEETELGARFRQRCEHLVIGKVNWAGKKKWALLKMTFPRPNYKPHDATLWLKLGLEYSLRRARKQRGSGQQRGLWESTWLKIQGAPAQDWCFPWEWGTACLLVHVTQAGLQTCFPALGYRCVRGSCDALFSSRRSRIEF